MRRARQEKLLVATLLLQPSQLRAAGVRLAERDEAEDGDEGEQRGDGERADELFRPDRHRNACGHAYERSPAEGAFPSSVVDRFWRDLHRRSALLGHAR